MYISVSDVCQNKVKKAKNAQNEKKNHDFIQFEPEKKTFDFKIQYTKYFFCTAESFCFMIEKENLTFNHSNGFNTSPNFEK